MTNFIDKFPWFLFYSSKTENETQNSAPFPIYRIEKRRPLHNKSIWTGKKDNA